jgi:hypothetical protein
MKAVHSLDDVAKQLGKSRRWLRDWLRDHPRDSHDRPLYAAAGRTKVFSDAHIARILEALPCPSASSQPAVGKRKSSTSAARTSASAWTKAAALTGDLSLDPSSSASRRRSSEANTRRAKFHIVSHRS